MSVMLPDGKRVNRFPSHLGVLKKKLFRIFSAVVTLALTTGAALADGSSTGNSAPPPSARPDGRAYIWSG